MSWLQSAFDGNSPGLVLTLIVVSLAIALVLLFWIFRKIAGGKEVKAGRSRQPRLSVTDAAVVDDKRRLVLVRRDNVEHLIMIGGPTDVLIEQRIPMHAAAYPDLVPESENYAEPEAERYEEPEAETAESSDEPSFEPEIETDEAEPSKPEPVRTEAVESEPAKPVNERPAPAAETRSTPAFEARPTQAQTPTRPVSPNRPALASSAPQRPAAPRSGNGQSFDEQFSSDLEAAFNEDETLVAPPRKAPEEHNVSARRSVSATVAPPEPPAAAGRKRSESMEEEMQRLLDELSGTKPN